MSHVMPNDAVCTTDCVASCHARLCWCVLQVNQVLGWINGSD